MAKQPYKIITVSLNKLIAQGTHKKKIRPWLQNFSDPSQDDVPYSAEHIKMQVAAALHAQTSGFLLWDTVGKYARTAEALAEWADHSRGAQHE